MKKCIAKVCIYRERFSKQIGIYFILWILTFPLTMCVEEVTGFEVIMDM